VPANFLILPGRLELIAASRSLRIGVAAPL
jgi:hypothetical protein